MRTPSQAKPIGKLLSQRAFQSFSSRGPLVIAVRSSVLLALSGILAAGCGGGGGNSARGGEGNGGAGGSAGATAACSGSCPAQSLSADDVSTILSQGAGAAESLGVKATFAVLDRVGNVLAVYRMPGASPTATLDGKIGAVGGLEGVPVPSELAVISKAGTGAYLSSQGQAFSSRTASQIVQEHFDPGEERQPGGPLFGVQFSQLVCGDVTVLDRAAAGTVNAPGKPAAGGFIGPRPLPLGLSADPGGFPLYKNGDLVGGIGVEVDGAYALDRDIRDFETDNPEELIALAGAAGFEASSERVANNILVGGKALRYSDVDLDRVRRLNAAPVPLDPGGFRPVPIYFSGVVRAGAVYGTPASGVAASSRAGIASMNLLDEAGGLRFPVRDGAPLPGGEELKAAEVDAILDSALTVANKSRAAIRMPLDSSVRVSIFVVDANGTPIGFTQSQDAPIFGTDVSLQKARTALFFSSGDMLAALSAIRQGDISALKEDYAALVEQFVGAGVFGSVAMTSRSAGNLARPFYPDGIDPKSAGPLSLPFPPLSSASGRSWSPFNDGLQLDLIFQRLTRPIGDQTVVPGSCVDERFGNRLRNGIQIFAGSVPLYRNGVLIGAIGISGDGIDQDDMVAFLGASRRGLDESGHPEIGDPTLGFNAPPERRSDTVEPVGGPGTRLRYVNCPEAPFIGSEEQKVCDGM